MENSELERRFGAVIRRRRMDARLGQEKLAGLAGLHRTHLGSLERGEGGLPTLGVIHKLANALKTTMAALMADVESDAPTPPDPPPIPSGRPPRPRPEGPGEGEPAADAPPGTTPPPGKGRRKKAG